jgi:anti-sigma-K factor RskA
MKTERCRDWRPSLGAYVLGHLADEERAGLEAHLEGCPDCRAEIDTLNGVAQLLPFADPDQFVQAPSPSPELGRRIAAQIGSERRVNRRRRQWRIGLGLGSAVAATAAVLAILVLPSGSNEAPEQNVDFASLPAGMTLKATLEPHSFGTEIYMYVNGIRSGTLCRVYLRDSKGATVSAGSFRYRWGGDSEAVLSSALDLSRTTAIEVHAGNRTFVAPVSQPAAAA